MQPSYEHRMHPWPGWGRHEAGHPYAVSYQHNASAVITRDWSVDANLSLSKETYIPSRLMYGAVPQALLDEFEFWQDEADQLRGYSRNGKCNDVILVRLAVGTHVSQYGARLDRVR